MRLTRLIAFSVLFVFSFASGQWLEMTILLPDSLGGITGPQTLVWDSLDNTLFVGGDSGALVIDGATSERVARVWTGSTVSAVCYNPQNNKVYCANQSDDNVTVIDGASNAVLATVTAGDFPQALCYNPQSNKVYCANYLSDNVTVIDGATNAVLATVTAGSYPEALCYNPQNNKVYCAN